MAYLLLFTAYAQSFVMKRWRFESQMVDDACLYTYVLAVVTNNVWYATLGPASPLGWISLESMLCMNW